MNDRTAKPPTTFYGSDKFRNYGQLDIVRASLAANPIFPGQQIKLTWGLFAIQGVKIGKVKAAVYLGDTDFKIADSAAIALAPVEFGIWTGDQTLTIPSLAPGGLVDTIYSIGEHPLRLEVTSVDDGSVFTAVGVLEVVAGLTPVWSWDPPDGTTDTSLPPPQQIFGRPKYNLLINHDYRLLGSLDFDDAVPVPPIVSITGVMELWELRPNGSEPVKIETKPFQLVPGQQYPQVFDEKFKKNWSWLIPGVWIINPYETMDKLFSYTVMASYSDSYQNFYPDRLVSLPLDINIGVDDAKRGFANGALAALAIGLVAAIFSFGAGAALGSALAAGLGVKALDPPEPDSRYSRAVADPRQLRQESDGSDFGAIAALLNDVGYLFALIEAVDDTLNRLLGAESARDRHAADLQRGAIEAFVAKMQSRLPEIMLSLLAAEEVCKKEEMLGADHLEAKLRDVRRSGLSRDVTAQLVSAGVSDTAIDLLNSAAACNEITEIGKDLPALMRALVGGVVTGARYSAKRAHTHAKQHQDETNLSSKD